MAAGSIDRRSATETHAGKGCVGLVLALLTASLVAPAAAAPAGDQVAPLERLSTTIGDLKSSLTAIRQDLEGMRATTEAVALPALGPLCEARPAVPSDQLTRAAREVERLRSEGIALKGRIVELEKVVRQARTREVVSALVKRSPVSAIETAAAAELDPAPAALAAVAPPERAVPRALAAAGGDPDLQLRAELALAQLKIVELTEELQSTRSGQAELEAELRSLRSLTDAKIKHFMGWQ